MSIFVKCLENYSRQLYLYFLWLFINSTLDWYIFAFKYLGQGMEKEWMRQWTHLNLTWQGWESRVCDPRVRCLQFTGGQAAPPSATSTLALDCLLLSLLLVFRQAFTCLPNLMTAKTIPDTHTRCCGKRQGSKINAKTVPSCSTAWKQSALPGLVPKFHLLILWKISGRDAWWRPAK